MIGKLFFIMADLLHTNCIGIISQKILANINIDTLNTDTHKKESTDVPAEKIPYTATAKLLIFEKLEEKYKY